MSANFIALASAIIAGQGLLLIGVVLSVGRDRPLANVLLAMLIAVITVRIAVFHLLAQGFSFPILLGPLSQAFLFGGPLLYLYTRVLVEQAFQWRPHQLLHLLPALVSATATPWLYSPNSFTDDALPSAAILHLHGLHKLIAVCGFAAYVMMAIRGTRRNADIIEPTTIVWLRGLLMLSLLAALAVAAWCLRLLIGPDTSRPLTEIVEFGGYSLLFYLIATAGVRRHLRLGSAQPMPAAASEMQAVAVIAESIDPPILDSPSLEPQSPPVTAEPSEAPSKYERTSLTETRARQLWERMTNYMKSDEPYLNCDLSLAELAAAVDSYPRELSQVLNTIGDQTFYSFVNGYRAAKAHDLILNGDHSAMVDIALAAGFNGRSTMYKHFVKHFAVTPSQFRKTCHAV